MRGKRGGGRGRGRPRGPRPPSARDLAHTPAITTFYGSEQQPIAPIFQQHTGGGAAHVGNEKQEGVASVVDLTDPRGDSCQQSKKKRAGPANRGSGRGKGRRGKRQRS